AGHEVQAFRPQEPPTGGPAPGLTAPDALERERVAHDLREPLLEYTSQPCSFPFVFQPGIERVDIDRQAALAPAVVPSIFVRGQSELGSDRQRFGKQRDELGGVGLRVAAGALGREQRRVLPNRLAVLAKVRGEGPPGERLTWVPFTLPLVQKRTRRERVVKPP